MSSQRNVLLFGGGGCHDYKACCPVLESYLRGVPSLRVATAMEDLNALTAERLAGQHVLVVYHTGGELTPEQKRGVVEWVAAGNGYVGIHAAADSFKSSPEYIAMLGGVFRAHPAMRSYKVSLADNRHPAAARVTGYTVKDWEKWPIYEYDVTDEQYLLDHDPRARILATTVFRNRLWPVAWVKPWGKGKVFYLALGHNVEACRSDFFRDLFLGGVEWAADPTPDPVEPDARFAI